MNTLWRICRALFCLLIVAIVVLIAEGYRKDAGAVQVTVEINGYAGENLAVAR
jgi:hypothetical protein